MANTEQILQSINGALQSKKLYPPGHPSAAAPAKKTLAMLTEFLNEKDKLLVGYVDEALIFDDLPVKDAEKNYADMMQLLAEKEIEAIIFEKGVREKDLLNFLDMLGQEGGPKGPELQEDFETMGIKHITIKTIKRGMVEVYNDALGVVKDVMDDIRMGKIPKSDDVKKISDEMTDLVFSDTNAMLGLTMIKDYDNYLYNHSVNVCILSTSMGKFKKLDKKSLRALGRGSLLHDVGKTGVSEDIIKKPGGLSSDEWEKVKEHPVLGSQITAKMEGMEKESQRIVYEHHIRYDHSGYPDSKSTLHPLSLIVSVADAYDALTTLRSYQRPYHPIEAVKILKNLSGKHFDPETVETFIKMLGLYPVGTMVRLSTNEVGIVIRINEEHSDRPTVKVVYDSDVNELEEPYEIDLVERKAQISIVAPVDAISKDIDVGAFFEKEAKNA
jgi:HD-GYP domain-containing protein (c-di-GMP phosphodiesterase class II)